MIDQNTKIIISYQELEFHDKQIRAETIDECIDTLYEVTPQTVDEKLDMVFVNALRKLKGQTKEIANED